MTKSNEITGYEFRIPKVAFACIIMTSIVFGFCLRMSLNEVVVEEVGIPVYVDPCEYKDSEIYYKGDCNTANELLDIHDEWTRLNKMYDENVALAKELEDRDSMGNVKICVSGDGREEECTSLEQ